jgi:hypothetical protein
LRSLDGLNDDFTDNAMTGLLVLKYPKMDIVDTASSSQAFKKDLQMATLRFLFERINHNTFNKINFCSLRIILQ